MDKRFVMTGLGYALLGLALGIYMASSHNHSQLVTHAHIMLLGFVVSFVYGVCHRLWLPEPAPRLAQLQFYLHQAGAAMLLVGLFLLKGKLVDEAVVEPILGVGSLLVLGAMVLMKVLFVQAARAPQPQTEPA